MADKSINVSKVILRLTQTNFVGDTFSELPDKLTMFILIVMYDVTSVQNKDTETYTRNETNCLSSNNPTRFSKVKKKKKKHEFDTNTIRMNMRKHL